MKKLFSFMTIIVLYSMSLAQNKSTAMIPVMKDGKIGYVDITGKMVIQPKYSSAYKFRCGLAWVKETDDGKFGAIDSTGKYIIDPAFDGVYDFCEDMARVWSKGKWGYVNTAGKMIIEPLFDHLYNDYSEGYVIFPVGDKYTFIDRNGKKITDELYDDCSVFSNGLASVSRNNLMGFIDKTGKVAIELKFNLMYGTSFSEGLAPISKDGKWGYIDKTGNFAIQPQFESALNFSEGLAIVEKGGKTGFIDTKGNMVIENKFISASSFSEGRSKVEINPNECGYIDKKGNLISDSYYDCEGSGTFTNGAARIKTGGKCGYIDLNGKIIVETKYEWVYDFEDGIGEAYIGNNRYLFNNTGKCIFELVR